MNLERLHQVIVRPIVTEKSARLEQYAQYQFEVLPDATKTEIKQAIKVLFNVEPVAVRTINIQGKQVRRGRFVGKRKGVRKALVQLQPGQLLDLTTNAASDDTDKTEKS